MSEDDDPFEHLERELDDREGDPFDRLDSEGDRTETGSETPDSEQTEESSEETTVPWGEPLQPDTSEEQRTEHPQTGDTDSEIPDAEMGVETPSDVTREEDPFAAMDDAFTEMDVEQVDPDEVWQQLTDAKARGSVGEHTRTYAEVSKHSYCEQCEHFSSPPDVKCTHEGTEIVEFLDMETVRLVDCPVVAERKELENE